MSLQVNHNKSIEECVTDKNDGNECDDNREDDEKTVCDEDFNDNDLICGQKETSYKWIRRGGSVLCRWSDGLFYLAVVIEVDVESAKCLVEFEDNSCDWVRFDDVHNQLPVNSMAESDILCVICNDGVSQTPNEIVICDVCNRGYHQRCHKPRIGDEVLEPDVPWSCRLCVFALGTKEGGAEKNGMIGKSLKLMKSTLPYDMKSLTWDEAHLVNKESIYCYCGGSGHYYSKMLQCEKCLQWFHEGCIQVLETPLLYGDHYYNFMCAACNRGKESVKRIIMKWSDMVSLVLNNLCLQHGKRFFDIYSEIVPFVQNNCHMLKLSEDISKLTEEELTERILAVMESNRKKFMCGKELKKKSSMWALRLPFPFKSPLIFAPPFTLKSPSSSITSPNSSPPISNISSPNHSNDSNHLTAVQSKTTIPLMYGACRKGATNWPPPKNNRVAKKPIVSTINGRRSSCSSSSNSCATSTISSSSGCSKSASPKTMRSASTRRNKVQKTVNKSCEVAKLAPLMVNSDSSDFDISSISTIESLEEIIPVPTNFDGDNNPFLRNNNPLKSCLERAAKQTLKNKNHIDSESINCDDLMLSKQESVDNKLGSSAINHTVNQKELFHDDNNKFNILARRLKPDGTIEYLLEWK